MTVTGAVTHSWKSSEDAHNGSGGKTDHDLEKLSQKPHGSGLSVNE